MTRAKTTAQRTARARTAARRPRRRKRTVHLVALNVAVDPHPPGIYEQLLTQASNRAPAVNIASDRMAELAEVHTYGEEALAGQIWTYTRIDQNKPVVDLETRKLLAKSELDTLLSSGFNHRGFNYKAFWFGFDLRRHILTYERRHMSPRRLAGVLETIFNAVKRSLGIDAVSVNVVQSPAQLERVLALQLHRLEIRISRPNPDDLAGFREAFRKRLAAQHAKSTTMVLDAAGAQGLKLDRDTQRLARLAVANGHVKGHGLDEDAHEIVTRTTADSPLAIARVFDPRDDAAASFFARNARALSDEVLRALPELDNHVDDE